MQSNFFAKELVTMKVDFKKIVCFGLVASFGCLSAQEESADSRQEISMNRASDRCHERCISPGECLEETFGIECPRRVDEYDYDVYIVGDECEREACEEKKICEKPCERRDPCEKRERCEKPCERRDPCE